MKYYFLVSRSRKYFAGPHRSCGNLAPKNGSQYTWSRQLHFEQSFGGNCSPTSEEQLCSMRMGSGSSISEKWSSQEGVEITNFSRKLIIEKTLLGKIMAGKSEDAKVKSCWYFLQRWWWLQVMTNLCIQWLSITLLKKQLQLLFFLWTQ